MKTAATDTIDLPEQEAEELVRKIASALGVNVGLMPAKDAKKYKVCLKIRDAVHEEHWATIAYVSFKRLLVSITTTRNFWLGFESKGLPNPFFGKTHEEILMMLDLMGQQLQSGQ